MAASEFAVRQRVILLRQQQRYIQDHLCRRHKGKKLLYPYLVEFFNCSRVSTLTDIYSHKLGERFKWPSEITKQAGYFTCCLISDLVVCKQWILWSYMTLNVHIKTRYHQHQTQTRSCLSTKMTCMHPPEIKRFPWEFIPRAILVMM